MTVTVMKILKFLLLLFFSVLGLCEVNQLGYVTKDHIPNLSKKLRERTRRRGHHPWKNKPHKTETLLMKITFIYKELHNF